MKNAGRIIVGVSGASGAAYARRALEALRAAGVETHLVISKAAEMAMSYELGEKARDFAALADHSYAINDVGAPISSGSFRTLGMLIAPCSVRTMSEIATGVTTSLLTRAADVVLKERRRLVLMPRESPLHAGHCELMLKACQLGAIIAPPMPALYIKPQSIDDLINHSVGRVLDLFDIDVGIVKRWQGPSKAR